MEKAGKQIDKQEYFKKARIMKFISKKSDKEFKILILCYFIKKLIIKEGNLTFSVVYCNKVIKNKKWRFLKCLKKNQKKLQE